METPAGRSTSRHRPLRPPKAKEHQAAWAKHLGVPVEITNSIGMKLVLIPPGEFMMGSPKELIEEELKAHGDDQWYKECLPGEGPRHRVRITRPFYFGVYLVTQEEYRRVMGTNPSWFSAKAGRRIKLLGRIRSGFRWSVSWDDAVEFCRKLSEMPEERAAGQRTDCHRRRSGNMPAVRGTRVGTVSAWPIKRIQGSTTKRRL